LISVDSASFDFVNEHRKCGFFKGKEDVRALFFIVRSDAEALRKKRATLADLGRLKLFVLQKFELSQAQEAYEQANLKASGYGKLLFGYRETYRCIFRSGCVCLSLDLRRVKTNKDRNLRSKSKHKVELSSLRKSS
jgi:hypothetical protein